MHILILLVFIQSCLNSREIRRLKNKEGCDGIISFIENNWGYNEDKNIYSRTAIFNDKFKYDGAYRYCLNGLNKENIKTLLGEPNKIHTKGFAYYNDTRCLNNKGFCPGTLVEFNNKGNVNDVEVSGWWFGSH